MMICNGEKNQAFIFSYFKNNSVKVINLTSLLAMEHGGNAINDQMCKRFVTSRCMFWFLEACHRKTYKYESIVWKDHTHHTKSYQAQKIKTKKKQTLNPDDVAKMYSWLSNIATQIRKETTSAVHITRTAHLILISHQTNPCRKLETKVCKTRGTITRQLATQPSTPVAHFPGPSSLP